jgi:hypothetical protein
MPLDSVQNGGVVAVVKIPNLSRGLAKSGAFVKCLLARADNHLLTLLGFEGTLGHIMFLGNLLADLFKCLSVDNTSGGASHGQFIRGRWLFKLKFKAVYPIVQQTNPCVKP